MIVIPDRLDIRYEETIIYTTGGLVSGTGEFSIPYSGRSTEIEVTLSAPESGTYWEFEIGCP